MNRKSYHFVDRTPSPYLEVRVRDGQDVMRERRYFVKPSEKKKERLNKIKRMQKRSNRKVKKLY